MIGWLITALLVLGVVLCAFGWSTGVYAHGFVPNLGPLAVGIALIAIALVIALGYGLYKAFFS